MPICTNFATYTPITDHPSKKKKVDFRPFWGCVVWGVPARPWGLYSRIGNCSWVLIKGRVAFIHQRLLKLGCKPPALGTSVSGKHTASGKHTRETGRYSPPY